MKIHSLLGPKEIPWQGQSFVTDEFDDVEVPDELGGRLLEQDDAWGSARGRKKQKTADPEAFDTEVVGADPEEG